MGPGRPLRDESPGLEMWCALYSKVEREAWRCGRALSGKLELIFLTLAACTWSSCKSMIQETVTSEAHHPRSSLGMGAGKSTVYIVCSAFVCVQKFESISPLV